MGTKIRHRFLYQALPVLLISLAGITAIIHLGNIYMWKAMPFYGQGFRKFGGWMVIGRVYKEGYEAGFRLGDRIIEINGNPAKTLTEARGFVDQHIGALNRFTIERNGKRQIILIRTTVLGFARAMLLFGLPWLIGITILFIGSFVFFTAPSKEKIWSFFFFCLCAGLTLIFFTHQRLWFQWMELIELFSLCFLPATLFHMSFIFPFEIQPQKKGIIVAIFPYTISFLLCGLLKTPSCILTEVPKKFHIFMLVYLLASILTFLFVLLCHYKRTSLRIIKLKIRIIVLGFFLSVFMPLIEPIMNNIFNIFVFTNVDLVTLPFITMFPLSVGYAIAKHDLFEIDVFIKRTTGYLLSTATIACSYLIFILIMNKVTRTIFIQNQQLFNLLFILAIVFFFNPLTNKAQDIINILFYRKKYDYTEPVKQFLGEMTSIFELHLIINKLFNILSDILFIGDIRVFIFDDEKKVFFPYNHKLNRIITQDEEAIPFSSAVAELLMKEKREIQRESLSQNPEYIHYNEEIGSLFQLWKAQLLFPFITYDKLTGFMSLGNIKSGREYTLYDREILRIISKQVAIAIENANLINVKIEQERIQEDLRIAGTIQRRMLPEALPEIKNLSFYAHITPSMEIGGDFYDFIEIPSQGGKGFGIILGDVSGHGISGAFLMSAAHSISQNQVMHLREVQPVMEEINRQLIRETKKKAFVALSYCYLLPDKQLIIANAGHPFPLHYHYAKRETKFIENDGEHFPLGIIDNPSYIPLTLSLQQGDVILFYTDGIVEVKNEKGDFFGFDNLRELFSSSAHLESEEIGNQIITRLRRFSGTNRFEDDITLVIIKHIETTPLDTLLNLPISSDTKQIILQCTESLAKLCSLEQKEIEQLHLVIAAIYKQLVTPGKMYNNYKLLITMVPNNSAIDTKRGILSARFIGPQQTFLDNQTKDQLAGVKAAGDHYSIEILHNDDPLPYYDGIAIVRLIIHLT